MTRANGTPAAAPPFGFVRADRVLWRRAIDTVMVLAIDRHDREVVALSGTSAALWDVLAEPVAVDQAADILSRAYNAPKARIASDIRPVLEELVGRGVVERVELGA